MRLVAATVLVALTLGACTDLPNQTGAVGDCAQIDAAAFEARENASWRRVDLTGGGYRAQAAGQNMERCWQRVVGMNSPDRRCIQRNDLVVEMRTDDATSYYRIPGGTTYMLYGEAGQARCQIVIEEG